MSEEPIFDVAAAVAAEFSVHSNQCQTCVWLATLDPRESALWDAECAKPAVKHRQIFRAMKKRGLPCGEGSVEGHRNNLHTAETRSGIRT